MEVPTLEDNLKIFENKLAPPDLHIPKRNCLIQLFAIGLFGGLVEGVWPQESVCPFIEFATAIAGVIVIIRWCFLDARERDYPISFRLSLFLFLLLAAAFPYYILRTRQNRQALKVLGISALVFVFYCGLNSISYELGCMIYNARHVG